MDRLVLADVMAECRIGVYDWEQAAPQPIAIDLELPVDAAAAAGCDDLKAALDYGRLVTVVRELAQERPYALLETLADDVARRVIRVFGARWVRVRVKKRALPGVGYAAIEVERHRTQAGKARRKRLSASRARA